MSSCAQRARCNGAARCVRACACARTRTCANGARKRQCRQPYIYIYARAHKYCAYSSARSASATSSTRRAQARGVLKQAISARGQSGRARLSMRNRVFAPRRSRTGSHARAHAQRGSGPASRRRAAPAPRTPHRVDVVAAGDAAVPADIKVEGLSLRAEAGVGPSARRAAERREVPAPRGAGLVHELVAALIRREAEALELRKRRARQQREQQQRAGRERHTVARPSSPSPPPASTKSHFARTHASESRARRRPDPS